MKNITKDELEKMMPQIREQIFQKLSPDLQAIFDNAATKATILDVQPLTDDGMAAVKRWIDPKSITSKVIYL